GRGVVFSEVSQIQPREGAAHLYRRRGVVSERRPRLGIFFSQRLRFSRPGRGISAQGAFSLEGGGAQRRGRGNSGIDRRGRGRFRHDARQARRRAGSAPPALRRMATREPTAAARATGARSIARAGAKKNAGTLSARPRPLWGGERLYRPGECVRNGTIGNDAALFRELRR